MLYRLSLSKEDSFKEILEEAYMMINYRPYNNYIDIAYDRERLTARNQREILNVTALVNCINKIDKDDLIWIKYEDNYVLAKIKAKISLSNDGAEIKMPLKLFLISDIPDKVKNLFNDIKFRIIEDEEIVKLTGEILEVCIKEFQMEKLKEESCNLEFVKETGELLEVKDKNTSIELYEKNKFSNTIFMPKRTKRKEIDDDGNRGELVIELCPPEDNHKTLMNSQKYEIEELKKYVRKHLDDERKAMEKFLKKEEEFWESFFE